MTLLQDLQTATAGLGTRDFLRYLLLESFPDKTVVTASLRARSVVVLRLVADVRPATPVRFCHAGDLFPESVAYRDALLPRLGLSDVTACTGHESRVRPGDTDHVEYLGARYQTGLCTVDETFHLNDTLAPFDCWISAVYHRRAEARPRLDVEGRLIRVNLLADWSDEDVRRFMRAHELPFHPLMAGRLPPLPAGEEAAPSYAY